MPKIGPICSTKKTWTVGKTKQFSANHKVDGNENVGYSKLGTQKYLTCVQKDPMGIFILEVEVKMEVD